MLHIPLFYNPIGWIVLGATGYLLYKSGRKTGRKEKEEQLQLPSKEQTKA